MVTLELAQFLVELSASLHRQVGVLIDRRGRIAHVIVGDAERLFLPELGRERAGRSRFRGVRLVHTHLAGEPLSKDDLTDLAKLHLDLIAVLQVTPGGLLGTIELGHLTPTARGETPWLVRPPVAFALLELDFLRFIEDLEGTFEARPRVVDAAVGLTRAIVVHVTRGAVTQPGVQQSLNELEELCRTAGVAIVETVVQRRPQPDPRYVVGKGKLAELALAAIHFDAELVVFDQDLSPSQARAIGDTVELKVIDRTQLILDIFAQRAASQAGKLQVELAQLKYALPRLSGKGTAMSRLTGGIGGRGPGETKLEIDRRRAKDRIGLLQRRIEDLGRQRAQRRARRDAGRVPVAAIVGYTNAGKSTLLNTLTGAAVLAEDKLFATLDPTSRRLRFPNEVEFVLSDTVGFIRDLPDDLVAAFKATLEELREADVLVHVVDIVQPGWEARMASVQGILNDLKLGQTPVILAFNKVDRLEDPELGRALCRQHGAVGIAAIDKRRLLPLTDKLMDFYRAARAAAERRTLAFGPSVPEAPSGELEPGEDDEAIPVALWFETEVDPA